MIGDPVYLVACAKTKATRACAARDLYRSPWFAKARAYVEATDAAWFILSAEHGLLDPGRVVEPYDTTLVGMARVGRLAWARRVHGQLLVRRLLPPYRRLVFLAGEAYREPLVDWITLRGRTPEAVEVPMQGLGLGEQLAWLTANGPPARRLRSPRCDALRTGADMPLFQAGTRALQSSALRESGGPA